MRRLRLTKSISSRTGGILENLIRVPDQDLNLNPTGSRRINRDVRRNPRSMALIMNMTTVSWIRFDKDVLKGTDTSLHGSQLESGLTTPLPDKKVLLFILDRLQKLPDYFDMIEQPMDFGTVRKKLDNGDYKNLEELEARTIQDLAKRDFNNLKHEGDDGELQPKVIRRGRPPNSKNQRKPLETSRRRSCWQGAFFRSIRVILWL
ncbi:hypothetical protein OROGR_016305 [Orobanche gracilis]